MKIHALVPKRVTCTDVCIHRNGMQSVYVHHDGKKVQIQTDTVQVSVCTDGVTISCSQELEKGIRSIDGAVLHHAQARSLSWFGKELTSEQVLKLFKPSLCDSRMSAKCIDTDVFDISRNLQTLDYVQDECPCLVVLDLVGVHFAKKRFGVTWNVTQILAKPQKRISAYAFDDEDIVPV